MTKRSAGCGFPSKRKRKEAKWFDCSRHRYPLKPDPSPDPSLAVVDTELLCDSARSPELFDCAIVCDVWCRNASRLAFFFQVFLKFFSNKRNLTKMAESAEEKRTEDLGQGDEEEKTRKRIDFF